MVPNVGSGPLLGMRDIKRGSWDALKKNNINEERKKYLYIFMNHSKKYPLKLVQYKIKHSYKYVCSNVSNVFKKSLNI